MSTRRGQPQSTVDPVRAAPCSVTTGPLRGPAGQEWAYALPHRSESKRVAAFPEFREFLHAYNLHRGHTALKGTPPADRVPKPLWANSASPWHD